MNYNGTEYFYVTNLQGDVIELLDSQGNPVVSYQYDAWGTILHQTGGALAALNPYRYRGYRYDSETQWYYLQSRYYDSSIGRFISSDGLVGEVGSLVSHNMYVYGANNPVMNVDPSGYAPEWLEDYWEWVKEGYEAVWQSLQKRLVVDISYSAPILAGYNGKIGVSVIVDFEDSYLELYPHIGGSVGYSQGASVSLGVLENYDNPGDYKMWFDFIEGGYDVGIGHCFNPYGEYSDAVKAYYIEFSGPNFSMGRDFYFWDENLVFYWGE